MLRRRAALRADPDRAGGPTAALAPAGRRPRRRAGEVRRRPAAWLTSPRGPRRCRRPNRSRSSAGWLMSGCWSGHGRRHRGTRRIRRRRARRRDRRRSSRCGSAAAGWPPTCPCRRCSPAGDPPSRRRTRSRRPHRSTPWSAAPSARPRSSKPPTQPGTPPAPCATTRRSAGPSRRHRRPAGRVVRGHPPQPEPGPVGRVRGVRPRGPHTGPATTAAVAVGGRTATCSVDGSTPAVTAPTATNPSRSVTSPSPPHPPHPQAVIMTT